MDTATTFHRVTWARNHIAIQTQAGYWRALYRRGPLGDWHYYEDRGTPYMFQTEAQARRFIEAERVQSYRRPVNEER